MSNEAEELITGIQEVIAGFRRGFRTRRSEEVAAVVSAIRRSDLFIRLPETLAEAVAELAVLSLERGGYLAPRPSA